MVDIVKVVGRTFKLYTAKEREGQKDRTKMTLAEQYFHILQSVHTVHGIVSDC